MVMNLLFGLGLILVMVIASGAAVEIFEKLAHEVRVNRLILATMLVGFSTSLPELFVGLAAAVRSQPEIALGNVMGANLANLSWIIGGAVLVFGTIPVVGEYLKKELWLTVAMAMAPFLLISDGRLGRVDGLILVLLYFGYVYKLMSKGSAPLKHLKLLGRKMVVHRAKTKWDRELTLVKLLMALGVLGASSWMLINLAVSTSSFLGVSLFWIGLVVISIGTTLPELVLSLMASERREVSLILGNILGSVVVNSTIVLGIVAIISPITYTNTLQKGVVGVFLMITLGLFWLFTKSKHKLERWEGAVLVGIYAMFFGLQLILA
jgi:cation:H+ antiporter